MALFQRRPQSSDPKMFYTMGMNKRVLIAGLGNKGREYELTRHNAGFICLDDFVDRTEEMGGWVEKSDWRCHVSNGTINGLGVTAIKPMTMMNDSGEAIGAAANFYKIHPDQILVVHDELDINFGQVRMRRGGSDAGHNGIASVSARIGQGYGRVRIGIGPKKPARIPAEDFVLQKFTADEQKLLPNMTREVSAIINEYLAGGQELPHETRSFLV